MKSWKKLASFLFAIILGASLAAAPSLAFAEIQKDEDTIEAVEQQKSVIDNGNLLSGAEETTLNIRATEIMSRYDVYAVYVTVDNLDNYNQAVDYADDFVDAYGLDKKASNGCVVLLVCVPENQFALVSSGKAEEKLTSEQLNYMTTEINPYLGRGDWNGAGETFFSDVSQTLSGKQPNATSAIAYNGTYVIDDYGLFSDEQRASLEATATKLAQDYNMGVYLLVVDYMRDSNDKGLESPSKSQRTNFATSFYRANGLGLNKESNTESGGKYGDGIMLALAINSRDYVTIAYGQGSYSFSDEGIEAMENAVTNELGGNNWYDGSKAYYDKIGEQLEYYSARGKPWTEPDLFSFFLKIFALLGIPIGAAFVKVNGEKSAMSTAHESTEASNYLVSDSFELTHSQDSFVNTTLVATPIPKHEDSGGGGGFGGGGWGGGGGGGFSSSGGGKF